VEATAHLEHADDPVSLPIIARVREGLQQQGLLYVGDCKMAALQTRASLAAHGDFYLCPFSALQAPLEQIAQEVESQRQQGSQLIEVCRVDEKGTSFCIAQGYETTQMVTAEVNGEELRWQERRLLVCSMAAAQAAQASLQERLQKAQQALG
jgi:transposase